MAPNSSKNLPALMPTKAKNGTALVNEKIDERILRMLGLEDVFDIDYDTYSTLLKERMVAARMIKQRIPTEEVELITDEWKRIKGKKGRFKVKKITAASFKKGTAVGMNLGKQKLLGGIKPLALPPATDKMTGKSDMQEITDLLAEIIKSLTQQNKDQKKANERSRKEAEDARRALAESRLESGFKKAIQVAEKIIAPVKSLLKRIIDFFTAIFIGRAIYKLLDWFANKDNRDKIQTVFRFLGDHWPKLLALYIRFGTSFGKFVGGLSKLVIAGTLKLVQVAARLVGAKGVARFLGGRGGKLLGAGLQVAATVGTTMALSSGIENFGGIDGKEKEPKTPGFGGGGLANLKKLFGFFGGGSGFVSGQKGVDKIPAMLSDGEFVMSRGAVQKYGVNTLEAMNAAGGGTNRPRMISGTTYAQGGGLVSSKPKEREVENESKSGLPGSGGMGIRGTQGFNVGKGFAATYQGKDSVIVKNAMQQGTKYGDYIVEPQIILGGKKYFAQQKGNDIIYSSNYASGMKGQIDKYGARNKSYQGKGGGLLGGSGLKSLSKKDLPKSRIMTGPDGKIFVGYLTFQNGQPVYERAKQRQSGILENITNFFDPKGAKSREETLNARAIRMTSISDLEDFRRRGMKEDNIKKMMGPRYDRAVNDLKAKEKKQSIVDSSHRAQEGNYYKQRGVGGMGGLGPNYRSQELQLTAKANAARIPATKPNVKAPAPPSRPPVVVKSKPVGSGKGGVMKSTGGTPRAPIFGATCPNPERNKKKKILGIF